MAFAADSEAMAAILMLVGVTLFGVLAVLYGADSRVDERARR